MDKQDRGFIVDIVSGKIQALKSIFKKETFEKNIHKNRGKKSKLSEEILEFIDNEINVVNKNKYEKLNLLLEHYNY